MNDTVDILRKKGAQLDYIFLSAGFGLVPDTTELPNYDCSFARKSIIKQHSEELEIEKTIDSSTMI